MAINIGIFKLFSIFGTIVMMLIFFGGTIIGVTSAIREGNWKVGLSESGGRLLGLDKTLNEETEYLLNEGIKPEKDIYNIIFHLTYALSILFMFFLIVIFLFKIGNWLMGIQQFSPMTDILLFISIFGVFFAIEYLYTLFISHTNIIPLSGVLKFIINLPRIGTNLFG